MKISSTVTAGHRSLEDGRIYGLALIGLFATLSYVVSIFLQIRVTPPGGDAISTHLGNVVYALGVPILGGSHGGLGGALGMAIGDLFDPIYVVCALKTLLLKLCIGLITGLVAHKIGRISESSDRGYVFRFVVAASVCGLLLDMILGLLAGYYYKPVILGEPAAELVLARNIASTSINAMTSAAAVAVIYIPLCSMLIRAGFLGRFRWQEI